MLVRLLPPEPVQGERRDRRVSWDAMVSDGGRPKLLDLFCGAGGAGEGYRRAGFDVDGVDIEAHTYPPGRFFKRDAMEFRSYAYLDGFDVIHASPPCQGYSTMSALPNAKAYPKLIEKLRAELEAWGGPYVIENVMGARSEMRDPIMLCGSMFGLSGMGRDGVQRQLRRHRLFESNMPLLAPQCHHEGEPVGVYGTGGGGPQTRGYKAHLEDAREAMGIDWMGMDDLREAIPPAFTQFIGSQLLPHTNHANGSE